MTRPRPLPPTPLARTLLQCVILGLRCQKIIMPINFTHAGCSSFSPPYPLDQCRVGGKLHNKKLCLPFASNASGRAPTLLLPPRALQPRTVRVCRLRLILPHSFGSNLSCHAVIMTNKKGKKK